MKQALFRVARLAGLFRVARHVTRRRLRIIGFHGLASGDEYLFRPKLFMRPETLLARMRILERQRYPVLPLGEAVGALRRGTLPPCTVAITRDDGWSTQYRVPLDALRARGWTATWFLTTYYIVHAMPVFRLAVQYLCWKTAKPEVDLRGLFPGAPARIARSQGPEWHGAMWRIIHHGERLATEEDRRCLCRELSARLAVDYNALAVGRKFLLLDADAIREVVAAGVEVGLHTHRHRLPHSREGARRELSDNRAVLEPLVGKPLRLFCYPNGDWSEADWPLLAESGIDLAVTCDPGLNDATTHPYALRRILDSEELSEIEFEAELSGFADLLRQARKRLRALLPARSRPRAPSASPGEAAGEPVPLEEQHSS